MALFKPYKITTAAQLELLPIIAGQFIVVESTGDIYYDKDSSTRLNLAKEGYTLNTSDDKIQLKDKNNQVVSEVTCPSVVEAVSWNNTEFPDITTFDCYNKAQIDAMMDKKGSFEIETEDWVSDSSKEGYSYVATISVTGVDSNDIVDIYYDDASLAIATEAGADKPDTITGGIKIYAASVPSDDLTGTYVVKVVS